MLSVTAPPPYLALQLGKQELIPLHSWFSRFLEVSQHMKSSFGITLPSHQMGTH